MVEALQGVEEEAKRAEFMEIIVQNRRNLKAKDPSAGIVLSMDDVNLFSEDTLALEERVARDLARSLGIAIPDVEAIQAQYKRFSKQDGIARDDFPKMLRALLGNIQELKEDQHV